MRQPISPASVLPYYTPTYDFRWFYPSVRMGVVAVALGMVAAFAYDRLPPGYGGGCGGTAVVKGLHEMAFPAIPALLPDAPPLPEPGEAERDGLAVAFYPAGAKTDDPAAGDTRGARLVALHVPAGTSPTPFLAPGKFTAVWSGDLVLRLRDYYAFSAQGRGKLTVTVNDQVVLDASGDDLSKATGQAIRLSKGKNKFTARYESPDAGDAAVRLFWVTMAKDGDNFTPGDRLRDPVPPTSFKHNAVAPPVAKGTRVRDGRFLFAELRCAKCHTTDVPAPAGEGGKPWHPPVDPVAAVKVGAMPELSMDAPSLTDVGARLNEAYLAAWIDNPRSIRPDAHMPRVFHQPKADVSGIDQRSSDVAAYLATLGADKVPAAEVAEPEADRVEAGGRLYVNLNCTACHTPPDAVHNPEAAAEAANADGGMPPPRPRVPHRHVRAKFLPHALRAYLLNPDAHYAWNPMPNFRLAEQEAGDLAAYLYANAPEKLDELPASPKGDPAKGKQLVATSGCLNCHAIGDAKSDLKVPSLAAFSKESWARGCMAHGGKATGEGKAPEFALTDDQRNALLAFAATDRTSLARDSAAEFAERQFHAMRCASCHGRDGHESLLKTAFDAEFQDLKTKFPTDAPAEGGEVFAPDQSPPALTWAGEKLQPDWMAKFIAGQVDYKPRPYLHARMPGFPARAGLFAAGFAAEHGLPPTPEPKEKPNAELVAVGQKLAGRAANQSFSCVQCHAVGAAPPFAPFEAPAVNFAYTADRLRKDYYHWWVHNPQKVDPNTKMPAFERDDRKTPITTVYDGDAAKQFEAMWHYLLDGKDIKPPGE